VVLLAVAGWILWWNDVIPGHAYSWLVPAGLVLAGAAGIAASLRAPARTDPAGDRTDA